MSDIYDYIESNPLYKDIFDTVYNYNFNYSLYTGGGIKVLNLVMVQKGIV